MKVKPEVSKFFARIGKMGGSKSSPAKRRANRLNIQKRWAKRRETQAA